MVEIKTVVPVRYGALYYIKQQLNKHCKPQEPMNRIKEVEFL
jgi:hypothetical protein